MMRKREVDFTVLPTDSFTATVWEQDVEICLYSLDLMHKECCQSYINIVCSHTETEATHVVDIVAFAKGQGSERVACIKHDKDTRFQIAGSVAWVSRRAR
jgi:hypothetical protein